MRMRSAESIDKSRTRADAGKITLAIHLARAEGGVDAEEAQDAQEVLLDARASPRR